MSFAESIKRRRKEQAQQAARAKNAPNQGTGGAEGDGQKALSDKNKKERMLYWAIGGFFGLVLIVFLFSCGPRQGTMMYGVCKVFLERQVTYPDTLDIRFVEQFPMAARIGYNLTDAFGQYTYHEIECAYRLDPKIGLAMDSIWVLVANEREFFPQKVVDEFNTGIPAIVTHPPDLTLPPPLPRELIDLKLVN